MADLPNVNRLVFDLSFLQDALNELPPYMRNKENLVKILTIITNRMDTCQKEAVKMAQLRFVDTASGKILDDIAASLFINRSAQDDESLKGAIKLRALSQDSEGTRDEIVKLLSIISGGAQVKVFKGTNNYVEVVFSAECLNVSEVKVSLQDLFPINTNLVIGDVITGLNPFSVGSVHGGTSSKVGTLGSVHDSWSERTQSTAVMVISDERDL